MDKDPIEKEKEDNPNTPGAGLSKSQEAIQKTKELTDKITEVSGKVQKGMTYALYAVDGISTIRSLVGDADEAAYDTRQELKQQAKGEAIRRVKEELPTKQEIVDKLSGYSCDLEVIKAVKFTKTKLEEGLKKIGGDLNFWGVGGNGALKGPPKFNINKKGDKNYG